MHTPFSRKSLRFIPTTIIRFNSSMPPLTSFPIADNCLHPPTHPSPTSNYQSPTIIAINGQQPILPPLLSLLTTPPPPNHHHHRWSTANAATTTTFLSPINQNKYKYLYLLATLESLWGQADNVDKHFHRIWMQHVGGCIQLYCIINICMAYCRPMREM